MLEPDGQPRAVTPGRHPAVAAVMAHFTYTHLPAALQTVSAPCGRLAHDMVAVLPDDPQLTIGLQHLLAAKDCFVRAALARRQTDVA